MHAGENHGNVLDLEDVIHQKLVESAVFRIRVADGGN